jgi:hypothetical protein
LNIDDAVVFDCASQASTSAGCTTTVTSPNPMGNALQWVVHLRMYPPETSTPGDGEDTLPP